MSKDLSGAVAEVARAAVARGETGPDAVASGRADDCVPVTRVRPPKGWQLINVRELWQFRELLYFLTWRDVKVRYKQTALGVAWSLLQPAMLMIVFTILFSRIGKVATDLPYPVFSYLALVPWTFFATAITNGGNSVVGSERLVTKIYFPRLAIPFASVGAAVVDFLMASLLVVVMMAWYRVTPGPQVVFLPFIFFVILLLATGVGTLLAALNVSYRDFRYVMPFMIQLWLFGTPSVYLRLTDDVLKGPRGALLSANPMTWLIASFRDACTGRPLHWGHLGAATAVSVVVFLFGCFYFRRTEQKFADII